MKDVDTKNKLIAWLRKVVLRDSEPKWFVYMILASNQSLYTGITTDLKRRLSEHKSGKKGAKFFNSTKPKSIVFVQESHNRSEASKLEAEIKKLDKSAKHLLITSTQNQIKKYQF